MNLPDESHRGGLVAETDRRGFLAGSLTASLAGLAGATAALGAARTSAAHSETAAAMAPGAAVADVGTVAAPPIHPRSDWASGLPPLSPPQPETVKFLLVHHTLTPNNYPAAVVPARLAGMYRFHTTDRGWPDLAYNFLVDAHGGIWEGRSGSLQGPVRGDATGGSQGFAQLCCFIGDHTSAPPTPAAQAAMSALLAWLASRYAIDLSPGRRVTFVSRGSNRWPRGSTVTTDPIAAHRDMSSTECPGDAAYPLVRGALTVQARRLLGRTSPQRPSGGSAAPSETATAPSGSSASPSSPATPSSRTAAAPPASSASRTSPATAGPVTTSSSLRRSAVAPSPSGVTAAAATDGAGLQLERTWPALASAAGATAVGAGAWILHRRSQAER